MAHLSLDKLDSVCCSKMRTLSYTISQKWIIQDFNSVVANSVHNQTVLYSKPFWHRSDPGAKWKMQFYPAGCTRDGEIAVANSFSLFIRLHRGASSLRVVLNDEILEPGSASTIRFFKPDTGFGFKNSPRSRLEPYIQEDGSLHLWCRITVGGMSNPKCKYVRIRDKFQARRRFFESGGLDNFKEQQSETLGSNISKLFLNGDLTDFAIKAGDTTFRVHRCILAAQSPVFLRMFQGEFRECGSHEMEIPDISSGAIGHFLSFIYGKPASDDFSIFAEELLVLGEKYEVTVLKDAAEEMLRETLILDNVCQTLVLAEMQGAKRLRSASINLIFEHRREVIQTVAWTQLKSSHPSLIVELLELEWGGVGMV